MDFRNVLMAIVLSSLVLIGWAVFFEPPIVEQQTIENQVTKNENKATPSIEEIESEKKVSRSEAINKDDRIKLENNNIKGSISLEGGVINTDLHTKLLELANQNNKLKTRKKQKKSRRKTRKL